MKCLNCGSETSNPKFCSSSCSSTYNNKLRKKKEYYCISCGGKLSRKQKYCSKECFRKSYELQDITLGQAIYKKHHRSSAFALVRTRARQVVKDERQVCENCGYDKHVEVCHIKAISEFSYDTLLSEINKKENLALLCKNCHWEFDNGLVKLK